MNAPFGATTIIREDRIADTLARAKSSDRQQVLDILAEARELKGLTADQVAVLTQVEDPDLAEALFETARYVKEEIYGTRLVLFAPMYVSNLCNNECLYCAFRVRNKAISRRALSMEEIARETEILAAQGHKRVLLVAGEAYPKEGLDYILKAIETVYATKTPIGEIRRINVNIAPLNTDEFVRLKAAQIGTYQVFQETYHRETYARMHTHGPKKDYDWRITAPDRAMEAGIDDLGVGILFGLADWRFEMLALMQHVRHLENRFGVGPHTISVPRLEPATGSDVAAQPPFPVDDFDFRKIVAILRITVPYTGIIMSTRETAELRRGTLALGVSQISAGSRTNPGGYGDEDPGEKEFSQFSLGDHRPLDEVIRDIAGLGYIPSFCTGCYRLGRTGQDFMDMAKPGLIKKFCQPNAISTFEEYLMDFASPETRKIGEELIANLLDGMDHKLRARTDKLLNRVTEGEHDVYV